MIQAVPLRFHFSAEPGVIHFEIEEGGFLCAYHAKSAVGGGVMLQASAMPRFRGMLWSFFNELIRIADCDLAEVEVKIAGTPDVVEALTQAVTDLKLGIKGRFVQESGKLVAYFYTDTGRLRVQAEAVATAGPAAAAAEEDRASGSTKKRVLIVDDSKPIRKILYHVFSMDPDLEVVGAVESAVNLETVIEDLRPDVITMDIHMPDANGVDVVERILPRFPIPIVMISSASLEEGDEVLRALEVGAVDYLPKPKFSEIEAIGPQLAERVRLAASIKVARRGVSPSAATGAVAGLEQSVVVAIGSSTGGTEALRRILTRLPSDIPPILIAQHIPPVFSTAFAKRLNEVCSFEVLEAKDGDLVQPGRALLAPGGRQMRLAGQGTSLRVRISDDPALSRHKPSVDVLFESVADCVGGNAIGLILTGMGGDGAKGLLRLKELGARTIAQDEASCVVFGMPREAIRLGAAVEVVSLDEIPDLFLRWLKHKQVA